MGSLEDRSVPTGRSSQSSEDLLVRRIIAGLVAFFAVTGTLLVLPVYAAPAPSPHPIAPDIDTVDMGSVVTPADDAVVTTDGEPLPDGVTEAQATGAAPTPAPTDPSPPVSSEPTSTDPAGGSAAAPPSGTPDASTAADDDVASSGSELADVPALTVSEPDTDTFSSVGVTWRQDDLTDVVVQLRVKHANGHWGAWNTLAPDDVDAEGTADSGAVRGGTDPYWTGDAHGVQVIVQGAGGVVPRDVKVTLIDPGKSTADALPAAPAGVDKAHAADSMPPVYSRAQWGADESIRTWDPEYAPTIKAATLHHTADGNGYTADQVPAILRSMYAYHAITRGWGDIGYNVIVDKFGRIFEGRYGGLSSTVIGAHAGGFNTYTFGVSMLGNYDLVPVPQATVDAVSAIIAWKFDLYGVDPYGTTTLVSSGGGTAKYAAGTPVSLPTIFGHRDVGNTVCPGKYGYARLQDIRDEVESLSSSNPSGIVTTVTDATTGGIPDISPVQLATVVAANGSTTVFGRGSDNGIWYRTGSGTSGYGQWTAVPATVATSSPAAVTWDGRQVDLVVRGGDGAYWRNIGTLDSKGRPTFGGWTSLGGVFSSAPAVAALAPGRMAIVGRGGDGVPYQKLWNGTSWSGWTSLGGQAWSAPSISADPGNSRYVVNVIGSDNKLWQVGTYTARAGAAAPWTTNGLFSSHGVGVSNASWIDASKWALTLGTHGHGVVLLNSSGVRAFVGGQITSIAAVAAQSDGSYLVYGRGTDGAVWMVRYANGRAGTWYSLSGNVQ